jgi:phosphoribosyl-ATP pyrophosphohydrolase
LVEEAGKLANADTTASAVQETADLLYCAMVAARRNGVSLSSVMRELDLRNLRIPPRTKAQKRHSG